MNVFLDIETLPAVHWSAKQQAEHVASCAPKSIRHGSHVVEWAKKHGRDAFARTALDWRHARLLCIGLAIDNDPAQVAFPTKVGLYQPVFEQERELLLRVHGAVTAALHTHDECEPITLVTWNGLAFDAPLLQRWAVAANAAEQTRWWADHDDLMKRWAMGQRGPASYSSLADVCHFLGIDYDPGVDGSEVFDLWFNGELERIRSKCIADVVATREVYRKLRPL